MKKRIYIASGVVLLAVLVVFFTGFYPAFKIDGEITLKKEISTMEKAIKNYNSSIGSEGQNYENILGFSDFSADDNKSVKEGLIIRKIVYKAMIEDFGVSVSEEINTSLSDLVSGNNIDTLNRAASEIYGISYDNFRELVLLPEIRKAILIKHLTEDGINYEEWKLNKLKSARVKIYFSPYVWEEGFLELK